MTRLQAFIKQPLGLLRLPGLVIFWLRYRLATTDRQKARVWEQSYMKYGTNVSTVPAGSLEVLAPWQLFTASEGQAVGCCQLCTVSTVQLSDEGYAVLAKRFAGTLDASCICNWLCM